ncbi:hypothetical protein ACV2CF_20145, partial [Salmonella enterica subsp. enterica serovar Javiana]
MSQPRRKGLKRGKRTGAKLSRAPLQRRKALARNGVAPQSDGGLIAGMVKAAHPFTDAASVMLTLRQLGWKPAAPKGPGRDSAAGPVRSMTAP